VDAVNRNDVQAEPACWQPDGEFEVVATGTIYTGLAELERAGSIARQLHLDSPTLAAMYSSLGPEARSQSE
jgi:hypothetical protein